MKKCRRCEVVKVEEDFKCPSSGKIRKYCAPCRQHARNRYMDSIVGKQSKGAILRQQRIEAVKRGNFICSTCKEEKSLEKFKKIKKGHAEFFGLYCRCTECVSASMKRSKSKTRYGITEKQQRELFAKQNNQCAICSNPIQYTGSKKDRNYIGNVDHCHITGIVRGILCNDCNRGLGFLKDSKEIIMKAYKYLDNNGI